MSSDAHCARYRRPSGPTFASGRPPQRDPLRAARAAPVSGGSKAQRGTDAAPLFSCSIDSNISRGREVPSTPRQ